MSFEQIDQSPPSLQLSTDQDAIKSSLIDPEDSPTDSIPQTITNIQTRRESANRYSHSDSNDKQDSVSDEHDHVSKSSDRVNLTVSIRSHLDNTNLADEEKDAVNDMEDDPYSSTVKPRVLARENSIADGSDAGSLLSATTPSPVKLPIRIEFPDSGSDVFTEVEDKAQEGVTSTRSIEYLSFFPRGGWYIRWTDGLSSWDGIPTSLHNKLVSRSKNLPPLISVHVVDMANNWIAVFADGSLATSGSRLGSLEKCLSEQEEELKFLVTSPGGGWILGTRDGRMFWERMPSSLEILLSRRTVDDAPIKQICISGYGGWFIRFLDGECEWEGLPPSLVSVLIARIRKGGTVHVCLSPHDGNSYYAATTNYLEYAFDSSSFGQILAWGMTSRKEDTIDTRGLPDSVVFH